MYAVKLGEKGGGRDGSVRERMREREKERKRERGRERERERGRKREKGRGFWRGRKDSELCML